MVERRAAGAIVRRRIDVDYQFEGSFPELGLPDEQWVVLQDALPPATQVVANASRFLAEGQAVTAVPATAAARAPGSSGSGGGP